METKQKVQARRRRHRRVRKKIFGTSQRPRLAVYRSNRHIYAQLIDDGAGRTVAAASSLSVKNGGDPKALAKAVGQAIAEQAKAAGITAVTFDRGGFMFHGRVESVAEGARAGGLEL